MTRSPLAITMATSFALLACAAPAFAGNDPLSNRLLTDRSAHGDITQFGGARRLDGNLTPALRASLSNAPVKNVILLIVMPATVPATVVPQSQVLKDMFIGQLGGFLAAPVGERRPDGLCFLESRDIVTAIAAVLGNRATTDVHQFLIK